MRLKLSSLVMGALLVAALFVAPASAADNGGSGGVLEAILDWILWWLPNPATDPSYTPPAPQMIIPDPEPDPVLDLEPDASEEGLVQESENELELLTPTPTPDPTVAPTPTPEPTLIPTVTPTQILGTVYTVDYQTVPPRGSAPLMVRFTAAEAPWIDTYAWDFGDGYSHTDRDNFHTYREPGTYTATLTVSNSTTGASSSATMAIIVEEPGVVPLPADDPAPSGSGGGTKSVTSPTPTPTPIPTLSELGTATAVSYRTTPPYGSAPLMVRFTANENDEVDAYFWDFGDGFYHTDRDNFHTYREPGNYTATLTVSNGTTGWSTFERVVIIVEPPGVVPLPEDDWVTPTPTATPTPTPTPEPEPAPEMNATATAVSYRTSPPYGSAPLLVRFTVSETLEFDSYAWEYGDGYSNSGLDNFHTYRDPGTYVAVLTGSNTSSDLSSTAEFVIVVEEPGVVPLPEDDWMF